MNHVKGNTHGILIQEGQTHKKVHEGMSQVSKKVPCL